MGCVCKISKVLSAYACWLLEAIQCFFGFGDLPKIDDGWFDSVLGIVELLKLPHYSDTLKHKGAHLFYKVVKNHLFIDGNKRSAVMIIYIFI